MRRSVATATAVVLGGTLLPAGAAHASAKPPVVKIVLNGQKHTVSGAKGLTAGWVTFHISAKDGALHDISVGSPRPGFSDAPTKGVRAPQGVQRLAPHASDAPPGGASAPSKAEVYRRQAAGAHDGDTSLRSLGGIRVTDARGADLTVRLPVGTTWISDLFSGTITIKAAKGSNSSRPGHTDALISEGVDNVITSPPTLPRSGTLQFLNTNARGTQNHAIVLAQLTHGATKKAIEKYFAPNGYATGSVPIIDFPVTGGFTGMSPGTSNYLAYRGLKPGRYVLIDVAPDEKTGHVHAEDGSIRFVTVK
jgi:hypothetical protein